MNKPEKTKKPKKFTTITKFTIVTIITLITILLITLLAQFSPSHEIEKFINAKMQEAGLLKTTVNIANLDTKNIEFANLSFAKNNISVATKNLKIIASSLPYADLLRGNIGNMQGEWSLGEIILSGLPYNLPPLSGQGKWQWKNDKKNNNNSDNSANIITMPNISGSFRSADNSHYADFIFTPQQITVQNLRSSWQQATINSKEIIIHLQEKKPVNVKLQIDKMPLASLLNLASNNKASGTGEVSGILEITINPDGKITLGNSKISANNSGIIKVAPELLPGDSPEISIARKALADFHYSNLIITTNSANNDKNTINLLVEGNNPKTLDGRKIKLQVNLLGDVLETLFSTINIMNNPLDNNQENNQEKP